MYLPECPFEVCTTNRYTILTHEACVVARRTIKVNESIKFLNGIQVEMTEQEEDELSSRTDFSIVISSRKKRPSLFLGPARFANHDCESNARLSTFGTHGIHIVANVLIREGEEITVKYGDNYFGEDNCECLCNSCEKAVRNGWDPKGPMLPDSSSDDDSDAEEESKPSRKPTPKAKPKPVAKATRPQKRKRDEETPNTEPEGSEMPRKRGRWAKKEPETLQRPVKEKQTISGAKANGSSTKASQSMMAEWFTKRAKGELELSEDDDDVDMEQYEDDESDETLDDLHEQFQIKKRTPQSRNLGKRPERKRGMFGKMFDLITGATSRDISKIDAEIQATNKQTAALMHIDVAEVPQHYTRSKGKKPSRIGYTKTEALSPGKSLDFDMNKIDWFATCIEDCPEKYGHWQNSDKSSALNIDGQKKAKISKVTDKFTQAKSTPTTAKSGRSKSNLRNVLNANDEEASDIFEVPESPAPEKAPKRGRGRPRKIPRKNATRYDSSQRVEATQNSTDSSSTSSVFSTEGGAGEASSLTSTDQSPDRLDGFAAGNICQNIVEMYTTEASPVNEDWEEERKLSDQRLKGWSRGRLPVRKSSRRALALPEAQAITSIEPASQDVKQEDDDEEDCKRGPIRLPGDYHLTPQLLCTPYHRWVECRNCDEFFIQAEAYLTRIACPRCERHSKLYGYHWPKTDREGKHDTEERVLDHRTIHRFIDPEDERMEKKGKKGLAEVVRERETSSRLASEGLAGSGAGESRVERLRNSPRRSESRRKTRQSMQ